MLQNLAPAAPFGRIVQLSLTISSVLTLALLNPSPAKAQRRPVAISPQVVLVTGASSGIGKATAKLFAQRGYVTYATSIDTSNRLTELRAVGCRTAFLDVTDDKSMRVVVARIEREAGGVDILINNAGYGQNGVLEELPLDAIRRQFEVNVFGLVHMAQLVAPTMRRKGHGRIINLGSVGGDFTTPGASAYHASKYAVESFNDGLRGELGLFGIDVVLIKPGGVATNFVNVANERYPAPMTNSPYLDFRAKFTSMTTRMFDPKGSPYGILTSERVAEVIVKSASVRKPKTRYRIGLLAQMTPRIRRLLGDRGFERLMLRQIGVKKQKA